MDNSGRFIGGLGRNIFNIFKCKDRLSLDETGLVFEFSYTEHFVGRNFFPVIVSHRSFVTVVQSGE